MSHPFLTEDQHEKLITFAHILKRHAELTAITDDGCILLNMAINNVPKPTFIPDEEIKLMLFSDTNWAWLAVAYKSGGYSALKLKREYLQKEFCPNGVYEPERARKIFNGLLSVLMVDPRTVDVDSLMPRFSTLR